MVNWITSEYKAWISNVDESVKNKDQKKKKTEN